MLGFGSPNVIYYVACNCPTLTLASAAAIRLSRIARYRLRNNNFRLISCEFVRVWSPAMPLCARSHLQRWRKTITEIQIDQNLSLNARSRDCCAQEPTHFVPGKSFLDFKQLKSILSERIDFNGLFLSSK